MNTFSSLIVISEEQLNVEQAIKIAMDDMGFSNPRDLLIYLSLPNGARKITLDITKYQLHFKFFDDTVLTDKKFLALMKQMIAELFKGSSIGLKYPEFNDKCKLDPIDGVEVFILK